MYVSYFYIHIFLIFSFNFIFVSSDLSFRRLIKKVLQLPRQLGQLVGLKESCSKKWIQTDKIGLQNKLAGALYGQPIAQKIIPDVMNKHWEHQLSSKKLLLCFFGGPGTGKTYSTKLINSYIFKEGSKSYYYLFYSGADSFKNGAGMRELMDSMVESIMDSINECPFTIVVFDEADKYPKGFLDAVIQPFLLDNTDMSDKKATFIFITNVGSQQVMDVSLNIVNSYFKNEDILHYLPIVDSLTSQSKDSFFSSKLVQKKKVMYFIPFLPHKKDSFIKCLEHTLYVFAPILKDEHCRADVYREIIGEQNFIPESNPLFVSSGCKRLESLVSRKLMEIQRRLRLEEL